MLEFDGDGASFGRDTGRLFGEERSPWAAQPSHVSYTRAFRLGGTTDRTPGEYLHVDNATGEPEASSETNERLHPSVRCRLLKSLTKEWISEGPDKKKVQLDWKPPALSGFTLVPVPPSTTGGSTSTTWKWVKTVKVGGVSKVILIPEHQIKENSWEDSLVWYKDREMLADVALSVGVSIRKDDYRVQSLTLPNSRRNFSQSNSIFQPRVASSLVRFAKSRAEYVSGILCSNNHLPE